MSRNPDKRNWKRTGPDMHPTGCGFGGLGFLFLLLTLAMLFT